MPEEEGASRERGAEQKCSNVSGHHNRSRDFLKKRGPERVFDGKKRPMGLGKLPPEYGRMGRRRGELVRLARYRWYLGLHLDVAVWVRVLVDVLVFAKHGPSLSSLAGLAWQCGFAIPDDVALAAIRRTIRFKATKDG